VVPAAVPRYDMVYVTKPLLNGSTVRTMKHQKNAPLAGDEEEGLGGGAEGTGPGDKPTTPGGRKKRRRLSTIGFFQGPTQEQIAAAQEADNEHTATTSPPNELAEKPPRKRMPLNLGALKPKEQRMEYQPLKEHRTQEQEQLQRLPMMQATRKQREQLLMVKMVKMVQQRQEKL